MVVDNREKRKSIKIHRQSGNTYQSICRWKDVISEIMVQNSHPLSNLCRGNPVLWLMLFNSATWLVFSSGILVDVIQLNLETHFRVGLAILPSQWEELSWCSCCFSARTNSVGQIWVKLTVRSSSKQIHKWKQSQPLRPAWRGQAQPTLGHKRKSKSTLA